MQKLRQLLGTAPVVLIYDALAEADAGDYTKQDIQAMAKVRPIDMKNDFHCLVDCDLVKATRKIGGVQLYAFDRESAETVALEALLNAGEPEEC